MKDIKTLEAIFEAVIDGVYTVDKAKKITSFNKGAQDITGFKEEEVIGRYCKDLLAHENERLKFLCSVECLLGEVLSLGNRTYPRRVFINTSTGLRKEVLTCACAIKSESGGIDGAAVYFREITNELRIEQLKSDFLSVVSHELRIPLATIKESISLLAEGIAGPINDSQTKILSGLKNHIDRLSGLVDSLLDVSSIESGRFKIRRQKLNVATLVKSLQSFFQPTADKKSIKLLAQAPSDLPNVIGDSDRLSQVFSNLLNNALKFTPEGGSITISCSVKDSSFVECSVIDTGVGIPKEMLSKLFERFEQLGVDESKRRGGAGLGLVISRKIVEDLGGSISAESEAGRGSKFNFTLPVYSEDKELQLELAAAVRLARQSTMSLALLKLETDLQEREFENLLSLINHAIRGPADRAIRQGDMIFVILMDTARQGVLTVKERIKEKIRKSHFGMRDIIKNFSIAVYPDDALTDKELLEKINENSFVF